jgi:hypothetical protein
MHWMEYTWKEITKVANMNTHDISHATQRKVAAHLITSTFTL